MRFEKGDVIVTGSKTAGVYAIGTPNEHFEINNGQVTICWSEDIDLNSAPDIVRVMNHILNEYDVDLSQVIDY